MDQNSQHEEYEPVNIEQLNEAADVLFDDKTSVQNREGANEFLIDFFQRKDIYLFIREVITNCNIKVKFIAINSFKNFVNSAWELVPEENRIDLRQYVWSLVFAENSDFDQESQTKLVEILVSITKYEYPNFWETFVQDLISAADSEKSCCSSLKCFEIFSQEISEFADNSLTSARAAEMLNSFTKELQGVIELIQNSLSSNEQILISQALQTFASLVKWIDPQFFFETNLLDQLCDNFLNNRLYTSLIIAILGEIVSMNCIPDDYYDRLGPIFSTIIAKLQAIHDENEEDFYTDHVIVSLIATTLTSFLSQYYEAVEIPDFGEPIMILQDWLINLGSRNDEEDMYFQEDGSAFYIDSLITYWSELAQRIYSELGQRESIVSEIYGQFLPGIRRCIINKMPSPYEIRDVEEEDGFTAHRVIFKTKYGDMFTSAKDALVLLTKINTNDTISALNEALETVQSNGFDRLDLINTTCWGFAAVVGSLSEQSNKVFVNNFLEFFITLFDGANEMGLDEEHLAQAKRVVGMASCFMAAQAHKFLLRDNTFFVNIVNWMLVLLQYPDEDIKAASVQCLQSLCSTNRFQMISKQTNVQEDQSEMSLLEQILLEFQTYYSSLSESSLLSLFSLTSSLIKNVQDESMKQQMFTITTKFLSMPLNDFLPLDPNNPDPEIMHGLTLIVQCNTTLAVSLGNYYVSFFLSNFDPLMEAFTTLTNIIFQCAEQRQLGTAIERGARAASDAIINLFERTLHYCYESTNGREKLFAICMTTILPSFAETPPIAKSPKVLKLFGTLASRCPNEFNENIKDILGNLYSPVFQMIKDDFESYDNIRLDFFDFILSLVRYCIEVIINLPQEELESFIEAIEFGMRHPRNDISEKGHLILSEFIDKIKNKLKDDQEQLASFTSAYAVPFLMFSFEMMTDTSHKSSFTLQVQLIKSILTLPGIGDLAESIFENLCEMFQDQQPSDIENLLTNLMNTIGESGFGFNNVLKDFLVSVKHLLPQDPDLIAAQKKEALERTREFFKKIESEESVAPIDGYSDI